MMKRIVLLSVAVALLCLPAYGQAPLAGTAAWAAENTINYRVAPNITYLVANGYEAKLDVYTPRSASANALAPTLIYIHGGGWTGGTKESAFMNVLPYLEMGWAVVNVEYRLARVSLAPAAVEDCRCALKWVVRNAKEYNIDPNRLVVTGHSAGGHLSLTTGMLPASAGLDRQCFGADDARNPEVKVAAIINWYGITDVNDLLDDSPNVKTYAVQWLSSLPNRAEVARRVSPLQYVRPGLPPILTIHGDADPTVPYTHAVRLHEALNKAGLPNQLLTIPGGKHGGFNRDETLKIFSTIREFLSKHGILK
ncbi:MAG: alpha/beta hydrolase [Blastocatellia bacterium]|nr:alpha/beta hydrolase [Blastocatellia bacterium]